ncbi:MAG: SDR family NAD(P)-dependent oxidoreductase [Bacteroidota bacterium]|nr:SDR family NAD(P)-dependent oxidoreductase [Bacteroidota bacterium]
MQNKKIILLTGATDGIGKQTTFMLAKENSILLLHGKNKNKGHKIKDEIIAKTVNKNIFYFNADFTSIKEIEELSTNIHKQFSHIDILINNAGIYENKKIILDNGIEKNFMVNHLASFSLTLKLLDLLEKSKNARIINVSSMIHASSIDFENLNAEKHYSGDYAYSLTKLCNILFSNELSSKLKGKSITVNSLHPGVINTKLLRAGWGAFGDSPIEGAKRIFYLAYSKKIENISGKYFVNDKITSPADISDDKNNRKKLWDISLKLV